MERRKHRVSIAAQPRLPGKPTDTCHTILRAPEAGMFITFLSVHDDSSRTLPNGHRAFACPSISNSTQPNPTSPHLNLPHPSILISRALPLLTDPLAIFTRSILRQFHFLSAHAGFATDSWVDKYLESGVIPFAANQAHDPTIRRCQLKHWAPASHASLPYYVHSLSRRLCHYDTSFLSVRFER